MGYLPGLDFQRLSHGTHSSGSQGMVFKRGVVSAVQFCGWLHRLGGNVEKGWMRG